MSEYWLDRLCRGEVSSKYGLNAISIHHPRPVVQYRHVWPIPFILTAYVQCVALACEAALNTWWYMHVTCLEKYVCMQQYANVPFNGHGG
jgi:hypothetical protein